jgi:mRNA interferase RelE/StbE
VTSYDLRVRPSVWKDVEGIPRKDLKKILARIEDLRDDPRPASRVKLSGLEYYRVRQGDYRIAYEIDDPRLVVTIAKVGHRRDTYKKR